MKDTFIIGTDTAAICIFDLSCLKHRLKDDPDWWADPSEELAEVNEGNAIIVGLPSDGNYTISIVDNIQQNNIGRSVISKIKAPSGNIFIGAGEDITGDDIEPDPEQALTSGKLICLPKGCYEVTVSISYSQIFVFFNSCKSEVKNHFTDQLLLFD